MENKKRYSCRAIIFMKDSLISIYRVLPDRNYYVYPGGGVEESELDHPEECVKREIYEELGINVKVDKLVYVYEDIKTIQNFYLCSYIDGVFGSGKGPEMINYIERKGHYIPTLIKVWEINEHNLLPDIVTKQLLNDINKYGLLLNNKVKNIKG